MKHLIKHLALPFAIILGATTVPATLAAEPALDAVYEVGKMVNINKADVEQLMTLKGIGKNKAELIIQYREQHGPFSDLQQLINVKGIGPSFIEKNKAYLSF